MVDDLAFRASAKGGEPARNLSQSRTPQRAHGPSQKGLETGAVAARGCSAQNDDCPRSRNSGNGAVQARVSRHGWGRSRLNAWTLIACSIAVCATMTRAGNEPPTSGGRPTVALIPVATHVAKGQLGSRLAVREGAVIAVAFGDITDQNAGNGSIQVLRRGNGTWRREALVPNPSAEAYSNYGFAFAAGSRFAAVAGGLLHSIAIRTYRIDGDEWKLLPQKIADDGTTGRPWTVAFIDDTLIVGFPFMCTKGVVGGAVQAFRLKNESVNATELVAADSERGRQCFGYSLCATGSTLFVGAPEYANAVGAFHVFDCDSGVLLERQRVEPPVSMLPEAWFGSTLCADGDLLVVGACRRSLRGAPLCGSAFVYRRSEGTSWKFEAELIPAERAAYSHLGTAAAIVTDKEVLIGAPGAEGRRGGSVHRFVVDRPGCWREADVVTLPDPGTRSYSFGDSIAIVDSECVVVGAPNYSQSKVGDGALFEVRFPRTESERADEQGAKDVR